MKKFKFNYAVRVNGDSPLMNMHLIKKNLKFLKKEKYELLQMYTTDHIQKVNQ